MKLIRSLPCGTTRGGSKKSMAVFLCDHCKKEVVRRRNSGLIANSCSCARTKRAKKPKGIERKCLKCQKDFWSEGNWNRFCVECKLKNESVENQGYLCRVKHRDYLSGHQHTPKI
jgi:hypothetical protein